MKSVVRLLTALRVFGLPTPSLASVSRYFRVAPELLDLFLDLDGIRSGIGGFLVLAFLMDFSCACLRIGNLLVRIDEADDQILQAHFALGDKVVLAEEQIESQWKLYERRTDLIETFLDALGDPDLAFTRQQLNGAHFAHVHAHRIGRAPELGVDGGERRGCFLGGVLVARDRVVGQDLGLGIGGLLVDRDAHIVDHVDDIFDLLRIDDIARQVVVDLAVGKVALLLALGDQQLQL
jgi:hypothetical protein